MKEMALKRNWHMWNDIRARRMSAERLTISVRNEK